MAMPDAGTIIGIGISLFGLGVAVHLSADAWLRVRRFERDSQAQDAEKARSAGVRPDSELATRLDRIEQIVELTAIEMERVAEGQRFVARALAEPPGNLVPPRSPERVITPH